MDESDDLIVVVNEKDNDPIINIYNENVVKNNVFFSKKSKSS
jgi:hypothetical protein